MTRRLSLMAALAAVLAIAGVSTSAPLPLKDLPPEVKASLKARFPKATVVGATREGVDHIEVKLKGPKGAEFEAVYRGKFTFNGTEVKAGALPIAVNNAIQKRYPGATIASAESIKNAKGAIVLYEVHIKQKGKSHTLYLTPKGNFAHEP